MAAWSFTVIIILPQISQPHCLLCFTWCDTYADFHLCVRECRFGMPRATESCAEQAGGGLPKHLCQSGAPPVCHGRAHCPQGDLAAPGPVTTALPCCAASLSEDCQQQRLWLPRQKKRKEKSMPLGVIMGASVPRSSPCYAVCPVHGVCPANAAH